MTTNQEEGSSQNLLYRVQEVLELEGGTRQGRMDVNDYLSRGWILLNVHSVSTDSDYGPSQHAVYVIGRII